MTDYSRHPVGLLDALVYMPIHGLDYRPGAPIYVMPEWDFGMHDVALGVASPRKDCTGCGAHDYDAYGCTYCKRRG